MKYITLFPLLVLATLHVCSPVILTVDRIEDGAWAVIETPDAQTYDLPLWALPAGTREGDTLTLCRRR